ADPLVRATADGAATLGATLRLSAPPQAASSRTAACQARARVREVADGAARMPSTLQVLAMVTDDADCARLAQGSVAAVEATARRSPYDARQVWLTVTGTHAVEEPPWHLRAAQWVRGRFLDTVAGLDGDGRILVPGVTLGILGQDTAGAHGLDADTDRADQLEDQCRNAGIIHLMAVSGGHYALLAAGARILGAALHLPWKASALLRLPLTAVLTLVLLPSQSVTRAAIGSLLGVGCQWCGRRQQALHTLAVTAALAILAEPARATDFGFALSCAAVAGIALLAPRLEPWLERALPRGVAQALVASLAAQAFTLPVQLLMEPSVALWALPANLLVGPCMDLATVCGLLACACSVAAPALAPWFARLCALGTRGIAAVAALFGSGDGGTLDWASGWHGVAALTAIELAIGAICWCVAQLWRARAALHADDAFAMPDGAAGHLRRWAAETRALWSQATWRPRGGIP
ncbi:MAG: ComEC/Rec2 family competence protein, partial [Bifidobacterium sp.]|nr:ComEC/Rec2 family competence protein [Bifidobacterium sp.]